MVRYYGYYSNVSRGKRKKAEMDEIIPSILESDCSTKSFRQNWARLIQKIYEVDPLTCPKCSSEMKVISVIEDKDVIKKILKHLVVKGLGEDPLMLLTSVSLRNRSCKVLWKMIRRYFRRWAIEDTIRFWKQSYDVENVRVLGYTSLQNLMSLISAVSYFAAIVLDTVSKLRVTAAYVLKSAKRVFGIPEFRYYAIADGLKTIFMRHPGKPYRVFWPKAPPQSSQLLLF